MSELVGSGKTWGLPTHRQSDFGEHLDGRYLNDIALECAVNSDAFPKRPTAWSWGSKV
jgi:hypothetical protein